MELLCICALICWCTGCAYISNSTPKESRTTKVTIRLCVQQETSQVLRGDHGPPPLESDGNTLRKAVLGHSEPFGNTYRLQREEVDQGPPLP